MPNQPGVTTSYYLQQRPAGTDEPWQRAIGINASWRDRATADDRLAGAREMRPDREHRLITRTTAVTDTPTESAVSVDQAALRDRIAEALAAEFTRDGGVTEGMRVLDDSDLPVPRRPRPTEVAAAVLAVLPAPADRAAIRAAALREAADYVGNDDDCTCGGCDTCLPRKMAAELRRRADEVSGSGRVADETQAERAHRCGNCEGIDPGTCLRNPNRAGVSQPNEGA